MNKINPADGSQAYVNNLAWEIQKGFVVISERKNEGSKKEIVAIILPRRAFSFQGPPEWNKETVINYNGEEHVIKYNESQSYAENHKECARMKDILARYQTEAVKQANNPTTDE